jgi:hypothetical protein
MGFVGTPPLLYGTLSTRLSWLRCPWITPLLRPTSHTPPGPCSLTKLSQQPSTTSTSTTRTAASLVYNNDYITTTRCRIASRRCHGQCSWRFSPDRWVNNVSHSDSINWVLYPDLPTCPSDLSIVNHLASLRATRGLFVFGSVTSHRSHRSQLDFSDLHAEAPFLAATSATTSDDRDHDHDQRQLIVSHPLTPQRSTSTRKKIGNSAPPGPALILETQQFDLARRINQKFIRQF